MRLILAAALALTTFPGIAGAQGTGSCTRQGSTLVCRDSSGWASQSHRQGSSTYTDTQGPQGQRQRCRSWRFGSQIRTVCD